MSDDDVSSLGSVADSPSSFNNLESSSDSSGLNNSDAVNFYSESSNLSCPSPDVSAAST